MPMSKIDYLCTRHDLPANEIVLLLRKFIEEKDLEEEAGEWLEAELEEAAEEADDQASEADDEEAGEDEEDEEDDDSEAGEEDEAGDDDESGDAHEGENGDWTSRHPRGARKR